jgi:hypothetical protein
MSAVRALTTLSILLITVVAGCVDTPEAVTPLDADAAADAVPTAVAGSPADAGARPTWKHGDWFEFEVKIDNTYVRLDTRDRVVVNRADATGYELGAGNRDLGVMDSHFDDFFVGTLDADLNARLGADETHLRMFDWPLAAGKSWVSDLPTDPFTGQKDSITLTAAPIAKAKDPRGEAAGFQITGISDLGYTYEFVYSSRVAWITHLTKTAPDGRLALSLELKDSGHNYEGVFHLVTKKTLFERVIIWPFFVFATELAPVPPADVVSINEEFTFVQEIVAAFTFDVPANGSQPAITGGGAFHIQIQRPDNQPRYLSHVGTGNSGKIELTDLEPYPKGAYVLSYAGSGIGGMYVAYHGFMDEIVEFGKQSHEGHTMSG